MSNQYPDSQRNDMPAEGWQPADLTNPQASDWQARKPEHRATPEKTDSKGKTLFNSLGLGVLVAGSIYALAQTILPDTPTMELINKLVFRYS